MNDEPCLTRGEPPDIEVKRGCFDLARHWRWASVMVSMAHVGIVALTLATMWGSVARANEAVDRCWQVKMGMSREEVSRVLGTHLPADVGWVIDPENFPCAFRIKSFGVYEIQITDHRAPPPHEAMFAEALRRGISAWGPPDWITFTDDRLKWTASWGYGTGGHKTFWIEPEPTKETFTDSKNGGFIHYMLTQ